MADKVWKRVYPQVLGRSRQLSLNKFFDPSTPSMRKVDDGKRKEKEKRKEKKRKKIMTFIAATNVVASRPPEGRLTGTLTTHANKVFGYYRYYRQYKPLSLPLLLSLSVKNKLSSIPGWLDSYTLILMPLSPAGPWTWLSLAKYFCS